MDAFKGAIDTFMFTKNPQDMSRAMTHLQRVSDKNKVVGDKIAVLGAPSLSRDG
jgi:hypothetical protein